MHLVLILSLAGLLDLVPRPKRRLLRLVIVSWRSFQVFQHLSDPDWLEKLRGLAATSPRNVAEEPSNVFEILLHKQSKRINLHFEAETSRETLT